MCHEGSKMASTALRREIIASGSSYTSLRRRRSLARSRNGLRLRDEPKERLRRRLYLYEQSQNKFSFHKMVVKCVTSL